MILKDSKVILKSGAVLNLGLIKDLMYEIHNTKLVKEIYKYYSSKSNLIHKYVPNRISLGNKIFKKIYNFMKLKYGSKEYFLDHLNSYTNDIKKEINFNIFFKRDY